MAVENIFMRVFAQQVSCNKVSSADLRAQAGMLHVADNLPKSLNCIFQHVDVKNKIDDKMESFRTQQANG